MSDILCEFRRAGRIEAVHRVAAAVVAGGRMLLSRGEADVPVFMRSCAKPFQALAVVETGAADAFGLSDAELAVVCGSHSGERIHVEAVRSILRKAGLTPAALRCGTHQPISQKGLRDLYGARREPSAVHNNCSGKHAGMLAAARHLEAPVRTYLDPAHPVQKRNLANVARFAEVPEREIPIGIDGCSAPNFALPVRAMARAIANFCSEGGAPARIRVAMTIYPRMVGRFCADLMLAGRGRIVAKGGAEGAYLLGLPAQGAGIALKVADGNSRAWPHVLAALLGKFRLLGKADLARVERLADPVLRNHAGRIVGEVRVQL